MRIFLSGLLGLMGVGAGPAAAEPAETSTGTTAVMRDADLRYFQDESGSVEEISIVARTEDKFYTAGSIHLLDSDFLERAEYDDIHQALSNVPGVYVRDEDGFGLRPNIGMRGAYSNRTQRITLLEDDVLLGPAPYSAPAAYYFPLLTRIDSLEVIKGPAAIAAGPKTVAGAIRLGTRAIPEEGTVGYVDVAGGSFSTVKLHSYAGIGEERWGLLVEGAHLQNQGFKELPSEASTGFQRTDLMAKGRLRTDPSQPTVHSLEIKGGFQSEVSNETYLGLAEGVSNPAAVPFATFEQEPFARYVASEEDQMDWERTQVQLQYRLKSAKWDWKVTAYRHDFHRVWRRFDGFGSGGPADVGETLRGTLDPINRAFTDLLSGARNSEGPSDLLRVTNNDRTFVSQGLQTRVTGSVKTGPLQHQVHAGARLHYDEIDRDHTEDSFQIQGAELDGGRLVQRGQLTPASVPRISTTDNLDSTLAGAFFFRDTIRWKRLTLSPGVRMEIFRSRRENQGELGPDEPERIEATRTLVLPGLGTTYEIVPGLLLLAGVHRGFTPPPPALVESEPETAWNGEAGLRFRNSFLSAEAIGFFSHYQDFVVIQTASTGGEATGAAGNLGSANIYGVEAVAEAGFEGPWDLELGFSGNYTFTRSEFVDVDGALNFRNPAFNGAENGDALPSVPEHIGALRASALHPRYGSLSLGVRYIGSTFDRVSAPDVQNDDYAVVDATARFFVTDWLTAYTRIDNLFDQNTLVSRLPFGARPGRPFTAIVGLKLSTEPPPKREKPRP